MNESDSIWSGSGWSDPIWGGSQTQLEQAGQFAQSWLDAPMDFGKSAPMPQQSWFDRLSKPWVNAADGLWKGTVSTGEKIYDKLPEVLFGWGMSKLQPRTVQENADTAVTYGDPEHSGGEPASVYQRIIERLLPGQPSPAGQPVQAAGDSGMGGILAMAVIGLVLYFVLKK